MKNLIEDDFFDDDIDEEINAEQELEKIQLKSLAESVLRDIQVTKAKHFKKDIKKIAKYYIKRFFKNKKNITGNKINIKELYSKEKIEKLININILESTKIIYPILEKDKKYCSKNKKEDVTNDIKLVNEALKKIYKFKIPQQFAGGILLVYLEVCKGIKIET
jgi:hypothetical protein